MKKLDLTAQRFGKLVVLNVDTTSCSRDTKWICLCDCGNRVSVAANNLRRGGVKSCGCFKRAELAGKNFDRLTAIRPTGQCTKWGSILWECSCECGNRCERSVSHLQAGKAKSCGCLRREEAANLGKRSFKHGLSNTRLFEVWSSMKKRCYQTKGKKFKYWGGRGITVCDEWRESFHTFYDWAISSGYQEFTGKHRLTLDRRDNNLGYSPENCRWSTFTVQNLNRRPREGLGREIS